MSLPSLSDFSPNNREAKLNYNTQQLSYMIYSSTMYCTSIKENKKSEPCLTLMMENILANPSLLILKVYLGCKRTLSGDFVSPTCI